MEGASLLNVGKIHLRTVVLAQVVQEQVLECEEVMSLSTTSSFLSNNESNSLHFISIELMKYTFEGISFIKTFWVL